MRGLVRVCGVALTLLVFGLAGCQNNELDSKSNTVFAGSVFGDLQPRNPKLAGDSSSSEPGIHRADGKPLNQNFGAETGSGFAVGVDDDSGPALYKLNFENTDIKEVTRAILNDALNVNYTVNGEISGAVTISSARPVSRAALLSTLEAALGSFGFALQKAGDGFRVSATGASGGTLDVGRRTTAGYGVSVVPLNFVTASEMLELLSGFVGQADGLRISKAGNSIIAKGSGPQRAEVVQAVLSFDADFMQDQRVSIFRLTQARPEAVVPELERIFNTTGESSLIQFRPVTRLRGVMAISKNPTLIRRAESWVRRLDQEDSDTGQNVVVYKARYRKAAELAKVMSSLFGSGSDTGAASGNERSQPRVADAQDEAVSPMTSNADVRVASAFDESSQQDSGLGPSTGPNVLDLTTSPAASQDAIRISADPSNNSVVIYGDSERAAQVLATLRKLDATPLQVAINVTIAEVRLTNELKYGVQYFITSKRLGLGTDNGSVSLIDQASNVLKGQIPGLNFVLGSAASPDVIISALDVIGDVEVLSSPSLVVLENQTATLQVGDEVPITTRQSQSIQSELAPIINQVEFKNTGIILNVTPRIGQNDAVTMQIEQEISSVSSGQNTLTPTISKRRVKSEISVNDQQTVLLGGLISQATDDGRSGVPGATKVPILSGILGTNSKKSSRTELVVLIKPVIIRDAQDASNVAEGLRSDMYVMGSRRTPLK